MVSLFAPCALLPDGWADGVRIAVDVDGGGGGGGGGGDGMIRAIASGVAARREDVRLAGPALPGLPNAHSHAFQRAMAGRAETRGESDDSFWTWREAMYGLVARLSPEQIEAIAAQAYAELLQGGFTAVAEFHYLHHQPDGTPYADVAETSMRVVAAARTAGMRLTLLPVLYQRGGFDGAPLRGGQLRFRTDPDSLRAIRGAVEQRCAGDPIVRTGLALHSLRAVDAESLRAAVSAGTRPRAGTVPAGGPIHIHAAEQEREVAECAAATGLRPVAWLLAHADLDARWCVVHATHVDAAESAALARSGAIVGLCPTTEANLGDGLFPLLPYLERGGKIAMGTDSHVGRSAADELRWLEYGQRLVHRRRHLAVAPATTPSGASVGASLYRAALTGGAAALGQPIGALAPGHAADLVVLDGDHADLEGARADAIVDAYVFSGGAALVRDVIVGGRFVVREGRHVRAGEIAAAYRKALRQ